jgi:hypothetical protein
MPQNAGHLHMPQNVDHAQMPQNAGQAQSPAVVPPPPDEDPGEQTLSLSGLTPPQS